MRKYSFLRGQCLPSNAAHAVSKDSQKEEKSGTNWLVKGILQILKQIFFWRYGRSTWQYDVLCVLILAFIFLTPKSLFPSSEPRFSQTHRNTSSPVWLPADERDSSAEPDAKELERRVRELTNRPDATIQNVRHVRDAEGRTIAYEVDIR